MVSQLERLDTASEVWRARSELQGRLKSMMPVWMSSDYHSPVFNITRALQSSGFSPSPINHVLLASNIHLIIRLYTARERECAKPKL